MSRANAPVGIRPLFRGVARTFCWQGLTGHASQRIIGGAGGLMVGIGRTGRPGAIAKEGVGIGITGRACLVERVGGSHLEDIERAVISGAVGIVRTANATAGMPADARISIGIGAANDIAKRIIGRRRRGCATGRVAIGRVPTARIVGLTGGLSCGERTGLTRGVALSIVAGRVAL